MDIGYPAAVEQIVFQIGFFVFLMIIGNFYGTEAFAAYNIGVNLLMICMTVGFGFSIAGSTLVGQHLGASDIAGAVRSGWRSAGFAVLSMGGLGLLVISFATPLAEFFIGDEPETVRYTVQFSSDFTSFTNNDDQNNPLSDEGDSLSDPDNYEVIKVNFPEGARFGRVEVQFVP